MGHFTDISGASSVLPQALPTGNHLVKLSHTTRLVLLSLSLFLLLLFRWESKYRAVYQFDKCHRGSKGKQEPEPDTRQFGSSILALHHEAMSPLPDWTHLKIKDNALNQNGVSNRGTIHGHYLLIVSVLLHGNWLLAKLEIGRTVLVLFFNTRAVETTLSLSTKVNSTYSGGPSLS